jgi:glucose-6-phosphate 1-dehydrogenase
MSTTGLSRPSNRVLVLFGATGDLAARKLFPGLFHLYDIGLMPERFRIIGSGRHAPDDFLATLEKKLGDYSDVDLESDKWQEFKANLSFVASSSDDGSDLAEAVKQAESEIDASGERLVYLSVPPTATEDMVKMLGETGIADNCSLVVEKPFGHDVASAKDLNATLHAVLEEEEIYRIDHFLGKEPVQNLLAARFANSILEPVWNRDHVNYVQIDVPEKLDIQGRASFYEETGAFRDMVVTHLMQILGVVALEPPSRIDAESLHLERTKVFEALRELDPAEVVFGQYDGYQDEEGVDDESVVETFVALTAWVDDWRWSGVPFYLRTGKSLAAGRRTVTIGFKDAPLRIFSSHDPDAEVRPTEIVFELTDDPKVKINIMAKIPGPGLRLGAAALTLDVDENFGHVGLEAYARLLHDVMSKDRLLFTQSDQIERLWQVCEPVIENPPKPLGYKQGSWGPETALEMPIEPGWRLPDDQDA